MSDQDDLGDDVGEESTGNTEGTESTEAKTGDGKPGNKKEAKPDRSKKGASKNGNSSAVESPPGDAPATSPDSDTPRAKALQAAALARAAEVKRRVGQTIKCPHCESLLYVEKTHPEKGLRDLVCKNPDCSRLKTKPTPYRRTVSLSRPIENEEEDHGVMSARQLAHQPKQAE